MWVKQLKIGGWPEMNSFRPVATYATRWPSSNELSTCSFATMPAERLSSVDCDSSVLAENNKKNKKMCVCVILSICKSDEYSFEN